MLSSSDFRIIGISSIFCFILIYLLNYSLSKKNRKQLDNLFSLIISLILLWMLGAIVQLVGSKVLNINPIYFDYFIYINICFLPVAFFFLSLVFAKTKISFNKWYCLLFIIPITSLVLLWTNNLHHLFYEVYSTEFAEVVYGKYFVIHQVYTLLLYIISLMVLMRYAVKNSGIFSRQAVLIFVGAAVPIITNIIGDNNIVHMSIYITPLSFAVTVICVALAISRFSLLKATPIALQRIVDRISDSYIVLNENNEISDFNETFLKTFNMDSSSDLRGKNLDELLEEHKLNAEQFKNSIDKIKKNDKTESFELYIEKIQKYFNIEITSIMVKKQLLGILILFKDISQHVRDMKTIQNNQDMLMENERLASLGQLIGGIAHNLKTPIMSIAGAAEGLNDLINEYDSSIDNPEVNSQDHHDIARDMSDWVSKIRGYTEYMSDIITTVKGQAVTLATDEEIEFTVEELIKRVDILMKHELKNALVYLNISMRTDEKITIHGDANSLVQVINNMISNSIQAYNGKPEQKIDMIFSMNDNNLIISIRDYAGGLPEKVQDRLFKEMITTKGKNGTGLGLYMSYSNIKARFNGDITFETNNEGTTFNIILPL